MAKCVRFATLSDIHVPHQDNDAIDWAIHEIAAHKPHLLVFNGDMFDGNAASRWPNEYEHTLQDEYDTAAEIMRRLREACITGAEYIFVSGNHDQNIITQNRIAKDVRYHVDWRRPQVFPEIEHWQVRAYKSNPKRCTYRRGQVRWIHGFKTGRAAAMKECVKYGEQYGLVVRGHDHRPTMFVEQVRFGQFHVPYYHANTGTMLDVENPPQYAERSDTSEWGQGLLLGELMDIRQPRHAREWNAESLIRKMAWGDKVPRWNRTILTDSKTSTD